MPYKEGDGKIEAQTHLTFDREICSPGGRRAGRDGGLVLYKGDVRINKLKAQTHVAFDREICTPARKRDH